MLYFPNHKNEESFFYQLILKAQKGSHECSMIKIFWYFLKFMAQIIIHKMIWLAWNWDNQEPQQIPQMQQILYMKADTKKTFWAVALKAF